MAIRLAGFGNLANLAAFGYLHLRATRTQFGLPTRRIAGTLQRIISVIENRNVLQIAKNKMAVLSSGALINDGANSKPLALITPSRLGAAPFSGNLSRLGLPLLPLIDKLRRNTLSLFSPYPASLKPLTLVITPARLPTEHIVDNIWSGSIGAR